MLSDFGTVGSNNSEIQLWDMASPEHPRLLSKFQTRVDVEGLLSFGLAISPDARVVALSDPDGKVYLWDIGNPRSPVALPPIDPTCPPSKKTCTHALQAFVGFTASDTLAVDASGGTLLYHIPGSGAPRRVGGGPLVLNGYLASAYVADPIAHQLLTADYSPRSRQVSLRVWDVTDPARPVLLPAPVIPAVLLGEQVAMADHRIAAFPATPTGGVGLWSVPSGKEVGTVQPVDTFPSLGIQPLALTLGRGRLAIVDANGVELRNWTITATGRPVEHGQPLPSPGGTGFGDTLAVSPDGTEVVVSSSLQTFPVFLLNLNIAADVRAICAMPPKLTRANRRQYVPDLPYSPPCG
jgi:WD40 repeat protein